MLLFNDLPWVANPTLYHCNSGIYGNQGKSRWDNKTMPQQTVCSCSWESEKAQWHTYALQVRVTLVFCQARILRISRKVREKTLEQVHDAHACTLTASIEWWKKDKYFQHCLLPQVNMIARIFFLIFRNQKQKYETNVTTCYNGKQMGQVSQKLYIYNHCRKKHDPSKYVALCWGGAALFCSTITTAAFEDKGVLLIAVL